MCYLKNVSVILKNCISYISIYLAFISLVSKNLCSLRLKGQLLRAITKHMRCLPKGSLMISGKHDNQLYTVDGDVTLKDSIFSSFSDLINYWERNAQNENDTR